MKFYLSSFGIFHEEQKEKVVDFLGLAMSAEEAPDEVEIDEQQFLHLCKFFGENIIAPYVESRHEVKSRQELKERVERQTVMLENFSQGFSRLWKDNEELIHLSKELSYKLMFVEKFMSTNGEIITTMSNLIYECNDFLLNTRNQNTMNIKKVHRFVFHILHSIENLKNLSSMNPIQQRKYL